MLPDSSDNSKHHSKSTLRDDRQVGFFWSYDDIFDNGDLGLSAHAKLVYLALCRHADKDGASFPGHKRLAGECSLSVSGVQRALKELQTAALVRVDSGKEVGISNTYTLTEKSQWRGGVGHPDRPPRSPRPTRVGHPDRQRKPSVRKPRKDSLSAAAKKAEEVERDTPVQSAENRGQDTALPTVSPTTVDALLTDFFTATGVPMNMIYGRRVLNALLWDGSTL